MALLSIPCTRGSALLILMLALAAVKLSGQGIFTPTLSDSWQATYANPALYGNLERNVTIGLPGFHNHLDLGGLTYNDIVVEEGDRRILDLNLLARLIDPRNELSNEFSIETIGGAFRVGKVGVGLSHRVRSNGVLDYPQRLVAVIAEGNAAFIGQTVDIAPFGFTTNFHEFALGAGVQVSDEIYLGGRVKYLSGIADLRIETGGRLALTTEEDNFALTLDQDLLINTAGTIDYNGLDDISIEYQLNEVTFNELFSQNSGWGVDVGAFFERDRLRLQLAANDIGATINWDKNTTNLRLSGENSFSGLDVLADVFDDGFSLEGALDSLEATFEPIETNVAYSSKIGGTYLAAGEFDLTEKWTLAGVVRYHDRILDPQAAVALGVRYQLFEALSVAANYSVRGRDATNLGLQLYGRLGPVRLLISTDDVTAIFGARDASAGGLRAGAALVFGGQSDQ